MSKQKKLYTVFWIGLITSAYFGARGIADIWHGHIWAGVMAVIAAAICFDYSIKEKKEASNQ